MSAFTVVRPETGEFPALRSAPEPRAAKALRFKVSHPSAVAVDIYEGVNAGIVRAHPPHEGTLVECRDGSVAIIRADRL